MVSLVRSSYARVWILAAALLCAVAWSAEVQQNLRHLENKDLTDLLEAKLDESFLHKEVPQPDLRRLQEGDDDVDAEMYGDEPTGAPTAAPISFDVSIPPTSGDRGGEFDIETSAPTSAPTAGAASWRRPSVGVAALSLVVGVVSAVSMA